jgi:hypothetical protein
MIPFGQEWIQEANKGFQEVINNHDKIHFSQEKGAFTE